MLIALSFLPILILPPPNTQDFLKLRPLSLGLFFSKLVLSFKILDTTLQAFRLFIHDSPLAFAIFETVAQTDELFVYDYAVYWGEL